jgi:hypothetical protein
VDAHPHCFTTTHWSVVLSARESELDPLQTT